MEDFRQNFLQMNSSNLNLFNNMASFEGFNVNTNNAHGNMSLSNDEFSDHHHHQQQQTYLPISYDDQSLRSIGPNGPMFTPMMAHFLPLGHGSNDMNLVNSSPSISENFLAPDQVNKAQNNGTGKKRKRANERETQKPKEVVHVRAKRGQATDSHSLAERLRREKINEKLRCLQDLVPGCYKTMGLAVMLDVISNYVRSLQNQIDFLSMKLATASLYYDFNSSEAEAMEALQGSTAYEGGQAMDKHVGDGYGGISHFHTAANWPL